MKATMKRNSFAVKYRFNGLAMALLLAVGMLFAVSCSNSQKPVAQAAGIENESKELAAFFTSNGNYIASDKMPALITAAALYSIQDQNVLVIDVRDAETWAAGNIPGSVNMPQDQLIGFFENSIDPPSFDRIVLVDARGQNAAYLAGIFQLMGYHNVYSLKFGMSSWSKEIAANGWDKAVGDELSGKLETMATPKKANGNAWPQLTTGGQSGRDIARKRAAQLLSKETPAFLVDYKEAISHPDKYYLISYWPEQLYAEPGHLPGAIQYTPKTSLLPENELHTLPTDKPVLVYCNTGHQSANVVAYLRMLGYDAYSVYYGANSFMHASIKAPRFEPSHYWSEESKNDFPLTKGAAASTAGGAKNEMKAAKGGC